MEIIKIDGYKTVLEDGRIRYYAIAGKKKYEMPEAYKDMYDDHHLAIVERKLQMPELFGIEDGQTDYVPLLTENIA